MPGAGTNSGAVGDVGIGTTEPAGVLDFEGGTALGSNSGAGIKLAASKKTEGPGGGATNGGNILILPGAGLNSGNDGNVVRRWHRFGNACNAFSSDVEGGTGLSLTNGAGIRLVAQNAGRKWREQQWRQYRIASRSCDRHWYSWQCGHRFNSPQRVARCQRHCAHDGLYSSHRSYQ